MMMKNLIWQEVQTALVALLFAVLIWVYAEGENVQTYELAVQVQFTGPVGTPLVVEPGEPQSVRVRLRCATSQRAELETFIDDLKLEVSPETTEQVIDLRERLRNHQAFVTRGIQITEVQAEPMRVMVEPRVELVMPVEVSARDLLLSPATTNPETVKVTGPASRMKLLDGLRLVARLDNLDANLPEGVPQERERVTLTLPPGIEPRNVTLEPERVRVNFTIRRRTLEYTVPLVTVFPVYQENQRFTVEINPEDRTIPSLVLEGPSNIIERIRRGELPLNLRADLLLTSDELDRAITEKVPEIVNLPAGVTIRSPLRPVRMRIARRDPAAEVGITPPRAPAPALAPNNAITQPTPPILAPTSNPPSNPPTNPPASNGGKP